MDVRQIEIQVARKKERQWVQDRLEEGDSQEEERQLLSRQIDRKIDRQITRQLDSKIERNPRFENRLKEEEDSYEEQNQLLSRQLDTQKDR